MLRYIFHENFRRKAGGDNAHTEEELMKLQMEKLRDEVKRYVDK